MDRRKLILLYHTIKHLRFVQVYYRLYYFIRNRFFKPNYSKSYLGTINALHWQNIIPYKNSCINNNTFEFLNLTHRFNEQIDWNYDAHGKLWTYNLNYFDFLNQEDLTRDDGLALIDDYLRQEDSLIDGKEPYPISLRGINWIKFLSKHNISNCNIEQVLYNHYQILIHNLEYHLLGNHLLENGFALLFGAYYFKDEVLHKKAKQILVKELDEQILKDGAHFELSPMYHQILLHRILDCINLLQLNPWKQDELLPFLQEKAIKMLSWLETITFNSGNIPMVNDSTYDIAPTSSQLFEYAKNIGLTWPEAILSDSGYRTFKNSNYECFIDVGNVGPTYQPGHAHSDTFSFELYVNNNPIIVDTGISTYQKDKVRHQQRETSAHNTVKIGDFDQSEIWDGFRVAKRAEIIELKEENLAVQATHNGYKNRGVLHTRKFISKENAIIIQDELSKNVSDQQVAHFHFHPNIKAIQYSKEAVNLQNEKIQIKFSKNISKVEMGDYQYAMGYNKTVKAKKVMVYFNRLLDTQIRIE